METFTNEILDSTAGQYLKKILRRDFPELDLKKIEELVVEKIKKMQEDEDEYCVVCGI
jgi:hypothetical protein